MKFILSLFILVSSLQAKGIVDASTYHSNSTLQWQVALDTIDLVDWSGLEHVLDLGCGDGKITDLLASKLKSGFVLGIDVSSSMIDFATSHYLQSNLAFAVVSAEELNLENRFDKVVSFSTLHWVLEQGKTLQNVYRALVPGGIACLQTYGKSEMNITSIGERLIQTEKWAPYFSGFKPARVFFSEEDYATLLKQAGFDEIRVRGVSHVTPYENRDALRGFVKPLLTSIRHLPEALQQEFLEEVVDQVLFLTGSSNDGVIHYKVYSIQAAATKPLR